MRVAYLINQYPKISHSFIRREILALEKLGFEIQRISLRGWDLDLADDADRIERGRTRFVLRQNPLALLFDVLRLLVQRPLRFLRALRMALRMSHGSPRPLYVHLIYVAEACCVERWVRMAGVEHVHAHFATNSAEVAMLVNALGGPPWSFTVHGPEDLESARTFQIEQAAFVTTVSMFGRAQLYRKTEPRSWPKIRVVHCGVDPSFQPEPEKLQIMPKRLVCVARLSPEKGHAILLEAARLLTSQGVHYQLILAGDGDLRPEIEAQIAQNNLTDRIQVTGWLSEKQVREEILRARALVLASFAEGVPIVIMEAMALRRPVIAPFIGGIPELVRQGEDGWLVPASDAVALADAMRSCLEAPLDLITHMGQAAHERVLVRHDVNTEAKKMRELFHHAGSDLSEPTLR